MPSDRRARRQRVSELARPQRRRLTIVALSSFIGGLIEAAFLVVITRASLAIAQNETSAELTSSITVTRNQLLLIAVLLIVCRAVAALCTIWANTRLTYEASTALRTRLANAFLHASWSTQQAEPAGRLQQLVSGFASRAVGVLDALSSALAATLSLIALMAVALFVSPVATLLVVIALGVLAAVLAPLRRAIRRRSGVAARNDLHFASKISELGALGLEMQTFGVRDRFSARLMQLIHDSAEVQRREGALRSSVGPIYTSLGYAALVGGLAAAAGAGVSDLGEVGAVMLVMLRSLSYGQAAQVSWTNLIAASPFLDVLDTTLERYETDRSPGGDRAVSEIGVIEALDMSFAYGDGEDVLKNLSFDIRPGEHIGVVGPSGSGKTTLVQLLLGLRLPTKGTLTFDSVPLEELDRRTLAPLVAFVAQDALLFSGTVAENIAFFRDIDRDRIEVAALQARLGPDLATMSDGLDTQVGERGSQLSGGQRQRVAIARALVGRPRLLVLDEPTSALDVHSEAAIRETIAGLRGEVSAVIIAHRLSTLDLCDRVMVIQNGDLLAFDEPTALARDSDFYREALALSRMQ